MQLILQTLEMNNYFLCPHHHKKIMRCELKMPKSKHIFTALLILFDEISKIKMHSIRTGHDFKSWKVEVFLHNNSSDKSQMLV